MASNWYSLEATQVLGTESVLSTLMLPFFTFLSSGPT